MKRRKITSIGTLLILCILLGCIGLMGFRLRGGVKMVPDRDYPIREELTLYRQDAPEWAADDLGDSAYTMESSGCLVTCIAAAISGGGETITPGDLNRLLSEKGVYDGEGNLQWGSLEELEGYSVQVYDRVAEQDMINCLEEGHFPIVRVRMKGFGSFHYVLIVGSENGDYVCIDPLEDEMTTLSDYAGRVYAVRCVWKEA